MKPIRILTALTLLLASTGALADWAVCAQEGGVCKFNGRHEVSFGAGKAWNTRVYENGVACTAERFGDPAPGVKKSCQIRVSGGAQAAATQWTPCAREDGFCAFDGRREVAYGVEGKWVTKVFVNGVKCSNAAFGDPAPGKQKGCRVKVAQGQAPVSRLDGTWVPCAREGQLCKFSGARKVSYGAGGKVYYRTARDGIACTTEKFGGDPAPGVQKSCHYDPK